MTRFGPYLLLLIGAAMALPGCLAPGSSTLQDMDHLKESFTSRHQGPAEMSPAPEWAAPVLKNGVGHVTTVASPESQPRPLCLAECIALALENGRTAEFFDTVGSERRTSVTGSGRTNSPSDNSDSVRVFAFDPALLATEVEQSLTRFDPIWDNSLNWNRTDRKSQELNPNPQDELILKDRMDAVGFRTALFKPLPTGGLAGVAFSTDYTYQNGLPRSQFVNPAYRPMASLFFEQPLLRGGGWDVNQLLDAHPGGYRNPIPTSAKMPGILLARIGQVKSQLEFERRIHDLLFKVEEAYWGLYSAYWDLYSRENGMKQAHRAWLIAKNKEAGGGLAEADLAMIEEQYHFFRTQRLEALGRGSGGHAGVLEAERRLRYVLGLPAEDGTRLVPTDSPTMAPCDPDWDQAWQDATQFRPELRQIQQDIKAAQLQIRKANDLLKPDLRLYSRYDVNGLGGDLGSGLQDLVHTGRSEWELGLHLLVPIGFREGYAELARARLQIAQRTVALHDQEEKLIFSLQRSYRDLVQFREEIQTRRSQQDAAARQLKSRLQKWQAGGAESIDLILRAQRNWVDAVRDEQLAVCNYKIALADYERQKGTILRCHQVQIADGTLPACVLPGASSHIRAWRQHRPVAPATLSAPTGSVVHPRPGEPLLTLPAFDPIQLLDLPAPLETRARLTAPSGNHLGQ